MNLFLCKTTFPFIFYFIRQQWLKFSTMIFMATTWAVCDAIFPHFLKQILDRLQFDNLANTYTLLIRIFLLVILFWILSAGLLHIQNITRIYTFPHFRSNILKRIFSYVSTNSHEYFS